jgi:chromosome partitioning protein
MRKMRCIAVALSKGGVGKTTTAVNLAAGLVQRGRSVLLVDMDTQGQVAKMLGVQPANGMAEVINNEANLDEVVLEARPGLWLLPGGRTLAGLKRVIDRKEFGGERTICETLAPLDGCYDYAIVDTAPGWDVLTVNALFDAQEFAGCLLDVKSDAEAVIGSAAEGVEDEDLQGGLRGIFSGHRCPEPPTLVFYPR